MILKKCFSPILTVLLVLSAHISTAQDNHFLYFQSANGEPFYIRLDGKLYSSTSSGYIILSKLKSADYRMRIGFPRDAFPEEEFVVSVNGENEGYLLKYLDNRWVLMNMNTMKLTAGVSTREQTQPAEPAEDQTQSNAFSRMLANVIKDSSILKSNQSKPSEQGADTGENKPPVTTRFSPEVDSTKRIDTGLVAVVQADSTGKNGAGEKEDIGADIKTPENTSTVLKEEKERQRITGAEVPATEKKLPQIESDSVPTSNKLQAEKIRVVDSTKKIKDENPFVRVMVMNEAGGQEMVFVNKQSSDTIRVFMPVATPLPKSEPQAKIIYNPGEQADSNQTNTTAQINPAPDTSAAETMPPDDTSKRNAVITYQDKPVIQQEKESVIPDSSIKVVESSPYTGCSSIANDKDFLKLRKKIAGENDPQKMLEVARKSFSSKCYTVDQVKNLSFLFLDDEGKYQFFDAAFGHVSNADLFYTLESQLKDSYYINRFKALLRN